MYSPDLFTVREAALVLRIGRTTAYELVHRDFVSGGAEGLGVVRIGGQFRIPRAALERLIGGPVSLSDDPPPEPQHASTPERVEPDVEPVVQPQLAFDL